jgi:hypothetical protein
MYEVKQTMLQAGVIGRPFRLRNFRIADSLRLYGIQLERYAEAH